VKENLLDLDAVGGSSIEAVQVLDYSLKKNDNPLPAQKKKTVWACTDAGDGGVGESLKGELVKQERADAEKYITVTCSIHAHSPTLCDPVTK